MVEPGKGFLIGGRPVGGTAAPFVIAEMSGNHNGSLKRAFEIVDAAAKAGAHAVKLQTYTADTMTIDCEGEGFVIDDPKSLWHGQSLHGLYSKAHTPWEWHEALFKRCRERGLLCFSSPFDASAVDFLEGLGAPCYKIASFENADLELIRKAAGTGKPLILSTGMATLDSLEEAVRAARAAGCRDLVLLKCTSTYPADPKDSNLATIPDLKARFRCEVGLSDHTAGIGAAVAAVALGARVIEKHFTLSRADGGVDAAFSLEPAELKSLAEETERAWRAIGKVNYGPSLAETDSLRFRRSLYFVKDMKAGEKITEDGLRAIRPGYGLAPKHKAGLLGEAVVRDVKRGTPASWDLIGAKAGKKGPEGMRVFFLLNATSPFTMGELCAKYLPGVTVEFGTKLPEDPGSYALIVPWNYRRLVPEKDLRPNLLVFHASDLPEGKGWATIYHAIASEKPKFAVTGFVPDATLDGGEIVVKARFPLSPNYTAPILRRHQEELCVMLVARVLERFGGLPPRGRKALGPGTTNERRRPEDNAIDPSRPFSRFVAHVRACESQHPAFFIREGVKFLLTLSPETEPEFPRDIEIEFFAEGEGEKA